MRPRRNWLYGEPVDDSQRPKRGEPGMGYTRPRPPVIDCGQPSPRARGDRLARARARLWGELVHNGAIWLFVYALSRTLGLQYEGDEGRSESLLSDPPQV
jgi:hypothetical protein